MLKNLLIFAFCIIAINASGELNIVKSPKSLEFKGNEKLDSESLGDVLSAALGFWVDDSLKWSGMFITNPFGTPKNALVVIVRDIDSLNLNSKTKTYRLMGSSSLESMNAVSSDFESSNIQAATLDFNQLSEAMLTMETLFGETHVGPIKATNSLKPELHSEDKDFLTQIAYLEKAATNYLNSPQSTTLLVINISLEPISKAHGEKSPALAEARKLIANLIETLSSAANSDTLFVAVAEKPELNRAKRETVEGESAKSLNLATYYNEDYPVIFNIILWFMVVLGFSVLAICYAIGSMDPGRDSIIYRMTSTRMKKDN
ncbi:ATPase H(+)-transporting accessory protein 2 [Eupeodes corollae]|uniref:ATPase H(+)-transporting accessory protein 2 n=1 Tax=Eupeodes corollae TaxID=290404 RepID=UPI0024938F67|nr:ATPase H(+)-transporting accessory protein 2 [Eupeodes corollae]